MYLRLGSHIALPVDLSRPQSFFAYIVAQEKTQLEASQIAKEEGWAQGAKVLRGFVDGNELIKTVATPVGDQ